MNLHEWAEKMKGAYIEAPEGSDVAVPIGAWGGPGPREEFARFVDEFVESVSEGIEWSVPLGSGQHLDVWLEVHDGRLRLEDVGDFGREPGDLSEEQLQQRVDESVAEILDCRFEDFALNDDEDSCPQCGKPRHGMPCSQGCVSSATYDEMDAYLDAEAMRRKEQL